MLEDSQYSEELQNLSLPELFEREDLVMEEILGIKDIHTKIKRSIKIFIDYCKQKHSFTQRLIMLGLKCPMHQSNSITMKNMTYIAADILTCDHESLADLFILPQSRKSNAKELLSNGDQIQEQIETDTRSLQNEQQFDRYKFLKALLDYVSSEELDENCLNYIMKALNVLIRRKINQFLEFLGTNQSLLKRMVEISHFPSIALFFAKVLADDEEKLSNSAFETKQKILPLILEKIHKDIGKFSTSQTLECIQNVLNSTRYGDLHQRSQLQKMTDLTVSSSEIFFFVNQLLSALKSQNAQEKYFHQAINSASYLSMAINRMNMDQQQGYNFSQTQEFRPTQIYQFDQFCNSFCQIIVEFHKFWSFKAKFQRQFWYATSKIVQPLILMTKHSRFGLFYSKISQKNRQSALQALIFLTCQNNLRGILLQSITTLLEKMLAQEEEMASGPNQIVFPSDLYSVISQHAESIGAVVSSLLQESTNQRNRNQNGIYFRKILLLLDNYFKHSSVLQKYPATKSLQIIFPSFNKPNCKLFAEKAAILNHPDGKKVKQVSQFEFILKNNNLKRPQSPQLQEPIKEQAIQAKKELKAQIVSMLEEKLKEMKKRVKQKQTGKAQVNQHLTQQKVQSQILNPQNNSQPKDNLVQNKQQTSQQVLCKQKDQHRPNFFVKHLMIY